MKAPDEVTKAVVPNSFAGGMAGLSLSTCPLALAQSASRQPAKDGNALVQRATRVPPSPAQDWTLPWAEQGLLCVCQVFQMKDFFLVRRVLTSPQV